MGINMEEEVFAEGKQVPLMLNVKGKGNEGDKITGYVIIDRRVYEVEQFEYQGKKAWKIVA
jgi:hypothetical protein